MKKSFIFLCLAASLLLSCEKDCEKDQTGSVRLFNTSQINDVLVFPFLGVDESILIAPGSSVSVKVELCQPGQVCPTGQYALSYQWEGSEEIENVWLFPEVCGSVELIIPR